MSEIQDILYKQFSSIATGGTVTSGQDLLSLLSEALGSASTTTPQTAATTSQSSGGIGSTIESVASTVFHNALGALPLVNGILSLFGGDDSPAPPPLVKYAMPPALHFEGAEMADGSIANVDYNASGMPRAYSNGGAAAGSNGGTLAPGPTAASGTTTSAPQITVNVQAMDARSFLDRSTDIAAAVRDAMLNLNSINDVVNDL